MENKVLIIATLASFIECFEMNDIAILQSMGYEVHLAANFKITRGKNYLEFFKRYHVVSHQIDFDRSPFAIKNIECFRELRGLIQNNHFLLVHCHTPVGGVLGRLASQKSRKNGTKVIYTVHGLQFCKGESLKNWVLYYPVERALSRLCDAIVTINKEDFDLVYKTFPVKRTYYIPGVGISTEAYAENEIDTVFRENKRRELGLQQRDMMIFSSGELTARKNHQVVIKAIKKINNPHIHYFIAGDGILKKQLSELIKSFGLESQVHLIGYRSDIKDLLCASDIFAFPSVHEGLGISLLEAMASGLPCVATGVQGINDLIESKEMLNKWDDVDGFASSIMKLLSSGDLRHMEGKRNQEKAKNFDVRIVSRIMSDIYNTEIGREQ